MKKGIITTYAMLIYVVTFIACSAGAIQHGFDANEHFFAVMGVMNLIFGGWGAYKMWRSENPKLNKEN